MKSLGQLGWKTEEKTLNIKIIKHSVSIKYIKYSEYIYQLLTLKSRKYNTIWLNLSLKILSWQLFTLILDLKFFKVLSFLQISSSVWNLILSEMVEINYLKLIHWFMSGDQKHIRDSAMMLCKVLLPQEYHMNWNEKSDYIF